MAPTHIEALLYCRRYMQGLYMLRAPFGEKNRPSSVKNR
jgi:hypothetical protein